MWSNSDAVVSVMMLDAAMKLTIIDRAIWPKRHC